MSPGPAPTLLDDWVTNQAFWGFIFLAAFAGVVWYTSEFLKRMHAASVEPEQDIYDCPGHDYEAVGDFWVCSHCNDTVRSPLNCGGLHRYETRGQSLECSVCGYRSAKPYDQMGGVA